MATILGLSSIRNQRRAGRIWRLSENSVHVELDGNDGALEIESIPLDRVSIWQGLKKKSGRCSEARELGLGERPDEYRLIAKIRRRRLQGASRDSVSPWPLRWLATITKKPSG